MTDWIYNDEVFIPPTPNPYEGFIYVIENLVDGRLYVGKKHFWTRRKDKRTKRRVTKESDWRNYYSSSEDVIKDVEALGKEKFKRTIIHLCIYKKQMSFLEQKEQWDRNVLLTDGYYNTNIGGKFFVREQCIYEAKERKITTKNDKWREIRSEQMKGDGNIAKREDVRSKISAKKKGEKHHQFGKPISEAHKKAIFESTAKQVTDGTTVWESQSEYMRQNSKNGVTPLSYRQYKKRVDAGVIWGV